MNKYVYIVYSFEGHFECFSSFKKAVKYCVSKGCNKQMFKTKFTTEYHDKSGNCLQINKEFLK